MTKGTIIIVTTWILAILTLFAIGIGFRMGLDIKLTGYNLDKVKALYIAKAAIRMAITEKWKEYREGRSLDIDAFGESWANNEDYFKDSEVGEGKFTLSYLPGELDRADKEIILYGLEDETGKISVNSDKGLAVLRNLLLNFDIELKAAEDIISSIEDWRDEDDVPKAAGTIGGGAEDSYYQALDTPYATSGRDFVAVEELLLVKGITEDLFYQKLISYLTIYGDGKININMASEEVLNAAFGVGYTELASKIIEYRSGIDGRIGTDDDRWFMLGTGGIIIDREDRGMVEVKNLNDDNWYGNIFGITDFEYKRLKELAAGQGLISTTSDYYRATVTASVNRVKKVVTTVFKYNRPQGISSEGFSDEIPLPDVEYLYWHEER